MYTPRWTELAMNALDEPIELSEYDASWPVRFARDAEELAQQLGDALRDVQHFGSTAVPGMVGKPIIDILLAPVRWPLHDEDREALEQLGYQHFGEAGVPGRIYFRRRTPHATNLAVVEYGGALFRDNLLVRDYLREHPPAREAYARCKRAAYENGARTLLAYSGEKAKDVAALLEAARAWGAERASV
jgi:GrpB-like predicted nucleotidyltransferase (UPF0157 family)